MHYLDTRLLVAKYKYPIPGYPTLRYGYVEAIVKFWGVQEVDLIQGECGGGVGVLISRCVTICLVETILYVS